MFTSVGLAQVPLAVCDPETLVVPTPDVNLAIVNANFIDSVFTKGRLGRVLEVGTGSGLITPLLNLYAKKVDTSDGDPRKLEYSDHSFDGVVMLFSTTYLDGNGTRQALREALRVLKPGGKMVFAMQGPPEGKGAAVPKVYWLDFNQVSLMAEEIGFRVEAIGRKGPLPGQVPNEKIYISGYKPL